MAKKEWRLPYGPQFNPGDECVGHNTTRDEMSCARCARTNMQSPRLGAKCAGVVAKNELWGDWLFQRKAPPLVGIVS